MRVSVDRLGLLMEHGLTDYQARVYLALIQFPSLPAGALAKSAQVPRNRLYEILEELQSSGLVEIILEETRKYRARPLSEYLERSVSDLRRRIDQIESQKTYLNVAFHPPDLSDGEELEAGATRVLLSRRAVAREIDRLVERATSSLVLAGSVGGWERTFRHLEGLPADDERQIEIYTPRAAAVAGGVERLAERWGGRHRWISVPLMTITVVADEGEMLLAHPVPDDGNLRAGRDFALLSTNPGFVRDRVELLRTAALSGV